MGSILIGCAAPAPHDASGGAPSTPVPVATPPSDDQLIAEAAALLDDWGHQLSDVASDPESDIYRLRALTTDVAFEGVEKDLLEMRSDQRYFTGYPVYRDLEILQRSADGSSFQILVCKDISALRAMRTSGEDITSPTRDNILPTDMDLVRTSDGLKIDRTEGWDGRNPC